MRVTGDPTNDVSVKAFAGATGVLIAMNVPGSRCKGLLGFAIERENLSGRYAGEKRWLQGMLNFPGLPHSPGELVPTNVAPIQKFRWSDYTVYPGERYAYTVHPVFGKPGKPDLQAGPRVEVKTVGPDSIHFPIFNRAVAGSQAFARANPQDAIDLYMAEQKKKKQRIYANISFSPEAYGWLSRGLLDTITKFIGQAAAQSALDIAIYEYELPAIRDAVAVAAQLGVKIRLLYHATAETGAKNLKSLKDPDLDSLGVEIIKRKPAKLMHDKFMVLSNFADGTRHAQAVLCGSTNFTENGVYRQANVVHVARDATLAGAYLLQFERMVATAQDASQTRKDIATANPIDKSTRIFAGFSPRPSEEDLAYFGQIARGVKHDILFTTVFKQISPGLLAALLGRPKDDVLRIGLQNTATSIIGVHKDRTATFVTPALLNTGIEGWLRESKYDQEGNILVHCKIIVADFTTDAPTVISGSHNFTHPASHDNDENYLVISCDESLMDVADAYGVEIMRLYDHYRFRWLTRQAAKGSKGKSATGESPTLALDDSWTKDYFGGDPMKTADRVRFCP